MKPVTVIEKSSDLIPLIQELSKVRHIAIDTESNSFYAYFERICLIQISADERDYIIDPFTLKDLKPLGEILEDERIEKIFHAASNDVLGLKRDFHFKIHNIFDTAVACKLLGYQQLGLAKVLEKHFSVQLNKKWQRYDWAKRPLKQEQLDYARLDTHYLVPLRHELTEELQAKELWEAAVKEFDKACEQEFQQRMFHPEAFIQIAGARSLDLSGRSILKALYLYREHEARRRNRAPFRILSNETLLRLARQRPKSVREFTTIKGLPRSYLKSHAAHNLLELIRKSEMHTEEQTINK
jgi:ribonuclease D